MRKGLFIAASFTASLIIPNLSNAGVYTCEVNGKKVYQGKPCTSADSGTAQRLDNTLSFKTANNGNTVASSTRIKFGRTPYEQLIKAGAIIESLSVNGRDCQWALKVEQNKLGDCLVFLGKLQEGGAFEQSTEVLTRLIKGDNSFYEQHALKFKSIQYDAEKVAEYAAFAKVHLSGD